MFQIGLPWYTQFARKMFSHLPEKFLHQNYFAELVDYSVSSLRENLQYILSGIINTNIFIESKGKNAAILIYLNVNWHIQPELYRFILIKLNSNFNASH